MSQKGISRKGIILAGGKGERLFPITKVTSKQLISVYDKPMIYYPLTTLMLSNIKDILIITNPNQESLFKALLGDGSEIGIRISYAIQKEPAGLAEAFIIGSEFLGNSHCALILGDNLFHGSNFSNYFNSSQINNDGATVFAYPVRNPEDYGVVYFNSEKKAYKIEEKPTNPESNFAITGIYFFDNTVIDKARNLKPSSRGELEISDINNLYLKENKLFVRLLNRGFTWLDTGTFESLHEAGSYIRTLEKRQGLKIGCPEEVAWRKKWITTSQLKNIAEELIKSGYGKYLMELTYESFK